MQIVRAARPHPPGPADQSAARSKHCRVARSQGTACQPGALNSAVTQSTIHSTICVSGYSSSIRPSTGYTNALKVKQIAEYGYDDTDTADYEEDHLIPLSLGGNPTSEQNLWPEPRYDAGGYAATLGDRSRGD